jgi:hypothetical protein
MPAVQLGTGVLVDRIIAAAQGSHDLDKALGRIAGVLWPYLYLQRVSVRMRVGDKLLLVGLWTQRPTRIGKGTRMRLAASDFPEASHVEVALNKDGPSTFTNEILQEEGVRSWASIPIPHPGLAASGLLTFSASADVFTGWRPVFENVGEAIGARLSELARKTPIYLAAESVNPLI